MKLIIFGATGTLGRHVVEGALAQGHEVTAVARNPAALGLEHPHLHQHAADVLDATAVSRAVAGHDAVMICLGAGMHGVVRETGTRHIIDAMTRHDVRRLVGLSTLGAGDSRMHLNLFWKYLMFGLLLRRALADHEAQEALIRQSGLDWVIVRPAAFTDDPPSADYKHGTLADAGQLALKIPRADIADFMLAQLCDNTYLRQAPALSC